MPDAPHAPEQLVPSLPALELLEQLRRQYHVELRAIGEIARQGGPCYEVVLRGAVGGMVRSRGSGDTATAAIADAVASVETTPKAFSGTTFRGG